MVGNWIKYGLVAAGLLPTVIGQLVWAGPKIQHWQGEEGSRSYFVAARELPIVDLQLIFSAGSSRDGDLPGLATMVANMLFEGTAELDTGEIARRFEDLGAEYGASASRDAATISLRSLSDEEHLQPALELLGKVLAGANFPDQAFERTKRNRLLGLQHEKERPDQLVERHFFQQLYGNHPYAHSPSGDEESVQRIERANLLAFKNQYYVGANMVVAMVGDMDQKQAKEISARLLANLGRGEPAPALAKVEMLEKPLKLVMEHPSTQTHIRIGHPAISYQDPDYFELYLGNHILGGGGLVTRISDEIREQRGLAYSAYSYFQPMRQEGPFSIGMQTRNDQTQEALGVLQQVLEKFINEGPDKDELERAKKNISGGFPLRLDSNKKILGYIGLIGFHQLPLDYLDTFVGKVQKISGEQIRSAFQRRISPGNMVQVTVGGYNGGKESSKP